MLNKYISISILDDIMSNSDNSNPPNESREKEFIPELQEKKLAPSKPIDYIGSILIGMTVCFGDMRLNDYINETSGNYYFQIFSYLFIIGFALIPAIFFSISKRPRGYGYLIGYILGGFVEVAMGNSYIGYYTSFVSLMLLIIPNLAFKRYRSVSKIKFQ
jgi:hypothetical protein